MYSFSLAMANLPVTVFTLSSLYFPKTQPSFMDNGADWYEEH